MGTPTATDDPILADYWEPIEAHELHVGETFRFAGDDQMFFHIAIDLEVEERLVVIHASGGDWYVMPTESLYVARQKAAVAS